MSKKSATQKPRRKLKIAPPTDSPPPGAVDELKRVAQTIGYIHSFLIKSQFKHDEFQHAHGAFLWLEDMSRQTIALIKEHEPEVTEPVEVQDAFTDFEGNIE